MTMYYSSGDLSLLGEQAKRREQEEVCVVQEPQHGGLEIIPDYTEAERIWKLLVMAAQA